MEAYEKMTIKEICEELDKLDVIYKKKSKKVELIEILAEATKAESATQAPAKEEDPKAEVKEAAAPKKETPKVAPKKDIDPKAKKAEVDSDKYAIIRTGGKQYQVAGGDKLRVEKLDGELGDTIELTDVLMIVNKGEATIGQPVVDGAKVTALIEKQGKDKKVLVFKKKKRKGYQVLKGHRQQYTALRIYSIGA